MEEQEYSGGKAIITPDDLRWRNVRSVDQFIDEACLDDPLFFEYKGHMYVTSMHFGYAICDMENEVTGKYANSDWERISPFFDGGIEEMVEYPFFDGRTMREAFDEIDFYME